MEPSFCGSLPWTALALSNRSRVTTASRCRRRAVQLLHHVHQLQPFPLADALDALPLLVRRQERVALPPADTADPHIAYGPVSHRDLHSCLTRLAVAEARAQSRDARQTVFLTVSLL
jgi:hypothetical protein